MEKLFLSNIVENEEHLSKLSKESLLKILNAITFYKKKSILSLVDEEIEAINDKTVLTISNIRINDIKREIYKTKYKMMVDFIDFKIYEYDDYTDIYFTGKETNVDKLKNKINEKIKWENYQIAHLSSRTIKIPHIQKIKKEENDAEASVSEWIKERITKIKKIETVKIRLYKNEEFAPKIQKKIKKTK